jgi:uncharacterized protein (UPF0276 family)
MSDVAVGLSLRDSWIDELLSISDRSVLDVLEVMVDDALDLGPRAKRWRALGARWPLIAHGTDLGIADAKGVDTGYVARVKSALGWLRARWYGEHFAFLGGLGHFAPAGSDPESLALLAESSRQVQDGLPCPLILENPADVLGLAALGAEPGRASGAAFRRALEAADVGALLDLSNLVFSARNERYDPADYLEELPWERVVEVHLAGGFEHEGLWIDAHDRDVDREALELLSMVAKRAPNLRAVIIERDEHLPPLAELLGELQEVKIVLAQEGRR